MSGGVFKPIVVLRPIMDRVSIETVDPRATDEPSASVGDTPSPVRSLLEHAPLAVLLLMMLLVTKIGSMPLSNGDTWFHLRLGHEFWESWSLGHPRQPTRFATVPWVPTEWSTEMLSAKLEDWFGLAGVAWMYGVIYLALVLGVYVASRRVAGPLAASVAAAATIFASNTTMSPRPQTVSLVLLAVVVGAWLATARDGHIRWWLIPLTWAWATAHGLWTAGVIVSFVAWLGLVLDGRARGSRAWQLLAIPVGSFLVALVTPVGPKLVLSQFVVGSRAPLIAEWGPTSFRTFSALVLAAMVAGVLILWLRSGRVEWMPVLLLGLACGWAILVTRLVAMAAVVVAPLLAAALSKAWAARRRPGPHLPGEKITVAVALLLCLAGLAVAVPRTAAEPGGVPTAFSSRLGKLPQHSAILVEDSSGAWIEWRFPGLDPVIDGLMDAYSLPHIKRFMVFCRADPGWQSFIARTGARVGVMRAGSSATLALQQELHWRVVQRTGLWVYVEAPEAAA